MNSVEETTEIISPITTMEIHQQIIAVILGPFITLIPSQNALVFACYLSCTCLVRLLADCDSFRSQALAVTNICFVV